MTTPEARQRAAETKRRTEELLTPHANEACLDAKGGSTWRAEAIVEALGGAAKVLWTREQCGRAALELMSTVSHGQEAHEAMFAVRDDDEPVRFPPRGRGADAALATREALACAVDWFLMLLDYDDPRDGPEAIETLRRLLNERLKAKAPA